jgi:hypothetical protein
MHVMPDTQEAETWRIMVGGQTWQKVSETPILINKDGHGRACLSSQLGRRPK